MAPTAPGSISRLDRPHPTLAPGVEAHELSATRVFMRRTTPVLVEDGRKFGVPLR